MTAFLMMACQSDEANAMPPANNNSPNGDSKTLVVYHSCTNNCRDIVTPLWWSQMAAIMQSYLFSYGSQMANKNIGLIVSSASSGISGVVSDCKRLVPGGKYFSQNLWISDSNRSRRSSLIADWLITINYNSVPAISEVKSANKASASIYSLNGKKVTEPHKGIYIVNGEKKVIE